MAAMKPSLYSVEYLTFYRATIVDVRLVPTLAPMTMGIPCCTVIVLAATMATVSEVVVDEDCVMTVAMIPRARHRTGLLLWVETNREPSVI